jgi:tRNA(fMet)-specific endonuclease VapC
LRACDRKLLRTIEKALAKSKTGLFDTHPALAEVEAVIYLLDTDTFIFMVRGLKPAARAAARQRAQALVDHCRQAQAAGDVVGLSAVTLSELEYGAQNSDDYHSESAAVRKVLTPFEIYDYDSVACPTEYGRVRHELESKGLDIGSMDLLIAAHALALQAMSPIIWNISRASVGCGS